MVNEMNTKVLERPALADIEVQSSGPQELTLIDSEQPAATPIAKPHTAQSMNPAELVRIAVERGSDLSLVEKLMDLQDRHEKKIAKQAFIEAMTAFKAEPLVIYKKKEVGYTTRDGEFVGYSHAELSDVTEVIAPAMAKHGLTYDWDILQEPGKITVTCTVTHVLGHSKSVSMFGPPDASGKKNANQQVASTTTFFQRYTLLAAAGMSTKGMDDDGRGGADTSDGDPQLQRFRDAAMEGYETLRALYEKEAPSEEFWAEHGKGLRTAARKVDADRKGGQQ